MKLHIEVLKFSVLFVFMSAAQGLSVACEKRCFIGFDLGTSGARISVIEKDDSSSKQVYKELHSDAVLYKEYDDPAAWNEAIDKLLMKTPEELLSTTKAICVSGTSASCLLADKISGKPTRGLKAKMYNYDITQETDVSIDKHITPTAGIQAKEWIDKYAPKNHVTRGNTSALSKLLHYHASHPIQSNEKLAHQSEYVANTFFLAEPKKCGAGLDKNTRHYVSDWHNILKLGYDVQKLEYPSWMKECFEDIGINMNFVLPDVVAPGQKIGCISKNVAEKYGICKDAVIVGGTTDSNAAFIAAAAANEMPKYGTAVTSLGSTLAIKMLSKTPVEDSARGVYSHRFPDLCCGGSPTNEDKKDTDLWLVGGASNVGCAILRKEEFSNDELVQLSKDMDVSSDSSLSYYPLLKKGERFPIADSEKMPCLEPKSEDRQKYLKGILQGIARVEVTGFEVFDELGAIPSFPNIVMTAGGGSKNEKWSQMRERMLRESKSEGSSHVRVLRAENAEASFGAAILAASSFV